MFQIGAALMVLGSVSMLAPCIAYAATLLDQRFVWTGFFMSAAGAIICSVTLVS